MENKEVKLVVYLKIFVVVFLLLLVHTCAVSQTLGVSVYKYQKKEVIDDSTTAYYSKVHKDGFVGDSLVLVSHDEFYLERNGICTQIISVYLGDFRFKYVYALARLGFVKYSDCRYYRGDKTAYIQYDGRKTKIIFTLHDKPVVELLKSQSR